MKAASIAEIKRALKDLDAEDLLAICLRLGRFKKENKELLTYLLFESQDEDAYISLLKEEITDGMEEINLSHPYYIKKGLQKMVRFLNKSLRYSGLKRTEVEVRMFFCLKIKEAGIVLNTHTTLYNLYHREIKRVEKALTGLHEDLQADYQHELEALR